MAATPGPWPGHQPLDFAVFRDVEGRPGLRLPIHLPPELALAIDELLAAWFEVYDAQPGVADLL